MQLFTRVPTRTNGHTQLFSFHSNPPVEPCIALQPVLVLFGRGKPGQPEVIPQREIPPSRFVIAGVTRCTVLVRGYPHQPVARWWCPKRKGSSGPWSMVGVAGLPDSPSGGAGRLCYCGYLLARRRYLLRRNPQSSSSMITGDRRGDFRPLSIRSVIARLGDPVRAQPL